MTISPDSESASTSEANTQITQDTNKNEGQMFGLMTGGFVANQVTINQFQNQTPPKTIETATDAFKLGPNPYRGLLPFQEKDSDRFFGREEQIETLWKKLCYLYEDKSTVRVLSIYGPSGSGKSSLARAGLIPQLRKRTLPGYDLARLAVLVPGMHPLEALATELARIDTKDATLVEKSEDFERYLKKKSDEGKYDGLRRIANILTNSDIDSSPLIILVDQFEEVYTYLPDKTQRDAFIAERDAFIENLLCAAADRSQRVSVILTLRSDFLGKTQQHPRLNQLFSSQGFLVPIMQPDELAIAISEPAKRARNELDKATVQLLVEQSKGQEGALPLLQFALTRIWEGLLNKIEPADTLEQIGGVSGALAKEAKHWYESLSTEKQKIARSIFLALIQLNDDRKATRRRAPISELITSKQDEPLVREVIECFARPGVWILVTFSNEQQVEMVEVAHEALIHNWKELEEWLNKHWEDLRKKRKIDQEAVEWQDHRKSKDYLLQGRKLRDAREFEEATANGKEVSLSTLAIEFITSSQQHLALTQIWNGLRDGVKPIDTFEQIGGIGGALANEAKLVYDSLTPEQQKIARSIFLALIQLDEDYQNTRRPALISKLITSEQDAPLVREVIDRFVNKKVWILVTISNEEQVEMLEVVHEALICNWEALQEWLYEQWKARNKRDEIEQVALDWQDHQKSKVYLLQGKMLSDAREFMQGQKDNAETSLSGLAREFVTSSQKKEKIDFIKRFVTIIVAPSVLLTPLMFHFGTLLIANQILYQKDCYPHANISFFLDYLVKYGGKKELSGIQLCKEYLGEVKLPGVIMPNSDFEKANLSNSDFSGAILADSSFKGASLAYANFGDALLMGTDFRCSDIDCADLLGANFKGANLQDATFENAFLEDADFKGSDLTNAKLNGVKDLTEGHLEGAILCKTIIPSYINISGDRNCTKN